MSFKCNTKNFSVKQLVLPAIQTIILKVQVESKTLPFNPTSMNSESTKNISMQRAGEVDSTKLSLFRIKSFFMRNQEAR